jgi:hypothetical protein
MPARHTKREAAVHTFTDNEVYMGAVGADYTLVYSPANTHAAILIFRTQSRELHGYFEKGCSHVAILLCISYEATEIQ